MTAARATLALEAAVRWREAGLAFVSPAPLDDEAPHVAYDAKFAAERDMKAIADAEIADRAAAKARAKSLVGPAEEDGA